jgi:hypothetical protein
VSAPDNFDPEAFGSGEADPDFDPEAFAEETPELPPLEMAELDLSESRPDAPRRTEAQDIATSKLGTATLGIAQGGSAGFVDELAGLARAQQLAQQKGGWRGALAGAALNALPGGSLAATGNSLAEGAGMIANAFNGDPLRPTDEAGSTPLTLEGLLEAYRQGRGEMRDMGRAAEKENPNLYLATNIVGGAAIPAGAATKATTVLGAAKLGGRTSAGLGALAGLGGTEADLTKGEVGGAAGGTALGGVVGGAFGAVGGGAAQYGAQKFARLASRNAEDATLLAINNAGISDRMAKLGFDSQEARRDFARVLLSQGLVKAGDTAEDILTRSRAFLDDYGAQIGAIIQRADDTGIASSFEEAANAVLGSLRGRLSIEDAASGPTRELANRLMLQSREAPNTGIPTTFDQLRRTKTRAQDAVNWGNESNLSQELYRDGTKALRDNTLEQLERVVGPDDVDELRRLNAAFGVSADLEEVVGNKASREAQKSSVGMKEIAAGHLAAGAVGGGLQGGIAGQAVQNALGAVKPMWNSTKAAGWDWSRNQLYSPASRTVRGAALELSRKSAEIMSRPRDQQVEEAVEAFSDAP